MINEINMYLEEVCESYDLAEMKINAIMEASMRELQINYASAELKVLTESGTDDDLAYLYEEANNGFVETVIKTIEKIKDAIIKFFSDMKDKILSVINKKDNMDTIDKVEKKVKLFPLLGKKKVVVENYNEEEKVCHKYLAELAKLKAKLKSGQKVETEDVEEVKSKFLDEHGKFIGIAAAVTITVTAAIALIKKMSNDAGNVLKNNEKRSKDECDDGKEIAKKIDNPGVASAIVSATTSILKTLQTDFVRCFSNVVAKVKEAIKGVGNTKIDTSKVLEAVEGEDPIDAVNTEIDRIPEDNELDPWDEIMNGIEDNCDDGECDDECGPEGCSDEGCCKESTMDKTFEEIFESTYAELFGEGTDEDENTGSEDEATNDSSDEKVEESVFDTLMRNIESLV